jgi:hypothetical protein
MVTERARVAAEWEQTAVVAAVFMGLAFLVGSFPRVGDLHLFVCLPEVHIDTTDQHSPGLEIDWCSTGCCGSRQRTA